MDLIGGYLLVVLILFAANFSLLIGNYKISNTKLILISFAAFIVSFVLMSVSTYLNAALSFLMNNFSYFFIIISILLLLIFLYYFRKDNLRISCALVAILFVISITASLVKNGYLSISLIRKRGLIKSIESVIQLGIYFPPFPPVQ